MQLQNINDFILCKVFQSTLIGLAQKWYQHLCPNSIPSFKYLAFKFKQRFISCIPPKKMSSYLQKVKRNSGKSLRSYIDHFNAEAIWVEQLNHKATCEAIKKESTNVKFVHLLIKN
ncbi:hypothetical protein P3X46_025209 [Hevea brasiliensis]|uniref:Retrotransposon gag domain-containing protein n=1 Tax=Hevea brasiliensis TaxID=3981 RepID=A0ABQ9L4T9_HEVBR|nr:hypothetical protein P3X46_025209 [Hevea brasiliensis]